ncbi:MAG TPA: TraR/DksA C4-type zinc finger protein [Acidimicrobiales bacterium]|nr:TraR/DksA C4-type zinc finger protein [Acidimicrobiales bacterium]
MAERTPQEAEVGAPDALTEVDGAPARADGAPAPPVGAHAQPAGAPVQPVGAQDQAADLALLDRAEQQLADIESALGRLDAGVYGTCEVCGTPIERERLEASPVARRCAAHDGG